MSEDQTFTLEVAKGEVQKLFYEAVNREALKVIAASFNQSSLKESLEAAVRKPWGSEKENWLERSVREAMHQIMWHGIQKVFQESGVEAMIAEIVKGHIASEEFKADLNRRVIESVKTTTFHVKPAPDEVDGEQ